MIMGVGEENPAASIAIPEIDSPGGILIDFDPDFDLDFDLDFDSGMAFWHQPGGGPRRIFARHFFAGFVQDAWALLEVFPRSASPVAASLPMPTARDAPRRRSRDVLPRRNAKAFRYRP